MVVFNVLGSNTFLRIKKLKHLRSHISKNKGVLKLLVNFERIILF